MSMIDVHATALDGGSGPYHEFLLSYRANEKIIYGFVEGKEDPSYYRGFIDSLLPADWIVRLVRSGNRDAVLSIHRQFDWGRFAYKRICFFIDRDLTEFLQRPSTSAENLYVTDGYAIENNIVSSYTFERVIGELLNITDTNKLELDSIIALFEENLSVFREALVPIMAQIIAWARAMRRPNLNDVKLDPLFSFNDAKLHLKAPYRSVVSRVDHVATCLNLDPSSEADLMEVEQEFRLKGGSEKFIRGKYLLWFFIEAALSLHAAIPRYCAKHQKPPKIRVTVGIANAVSVIASRSKMPLSLKEFIFRTYLQHIESR